MKKGITLEEAQKIAFEKKNPKKYFNKYFKYVKKFYAFFFV